MELISSDKLIYNTVRLVKEERRITVEILRHLREIERRRLYTEQGYSSLFEFTTKFLHYSEGSAYRRIAAMRLIKDVPAVEEKILNGSLSVSVAAQAASFIRTHAESIEEKENVVAQLEGKSSRQAEKALSALAPQPARPEKARRLNPQQTELRITIDDDTKAKLDRLRSLLSHIKSNMSYTELIQYLAKLGLEKLDPELRRSRATTTPLSQNDNSRHVPRRVKAEVWRRDGGRCTFTDPVSGHTCGARHFIELDHIIPYALGGKQTIENLRLRCRTHNQLTAAQIFGGEKTARFSKKRA